MPRKRAAPKAEPWWDRRIEYLVHAGRREEIEDERLLEIQARARAAERNRKAAAGETARQLQ